MPSLVKIFSNDTTNMTKNFKNRKNTIFLNFSFLPFLMEQLFLFLVKRPYTILNAIFSTMENKGRYAKP